MEGFFSLSTCNLTSSDISKTTTGWKFCVGLKSDLRSFLQEFKELQFEWKLAKFQQLEQPDIPVSLLCEHGTPVTFLLTTVWQPCVIGKGQGSWGNLLSVKTSVGLVSTFVYTNLVLVFGPFENFQIGPVLVLGPRLSFWGWYDACIYLISKLV
jgi:hypothetical protein